MTSLLANRCLGAHPKLSFRIKCSYSYWCVWNLQVMLASEAFRSSKTLDVKGRRQPHLLSKLTTPLLCLKPTNIYKHNWFKSARPLRSSFPQCGSHRVSRKRSICLTKFDYSTNSLQCIHGRYYTFCSNCQTLGPVQKAALLEAYAAQQFPYCHPRCVPSSLPSAVHQLWSSVAKSSKAYLWGMQY